MAYGFFRTLTINHAQLGATDLTNFPVLFSGTYSYLATVANSGKVTSSSGFDIIFTSDAAGATKLDHEIEIYTAASGLVVMWVRVPAVSSTVDTVVYLWYGNSSITTTQENVTGVWDSNFKGVWHMGNGVTQTLTDSTSNGNSLSANGTSAVAGKIDGGSSSPGTVPNGLVVTSPSNLYGSGDMTYSIWANPSALTNAASSPNMNLIDCGGVALSMVATSGVLSMTIATTGSYRTAISNEALATSTWKHVVMTYVSGAAPKLFLNGAEVTYSTHAAGGGTDGTKSGGVGLGLSGPNNYAANFPGSLDEGRVSNVARSTSWNLSGYNNQNSPSTFYTLGPEVVPGALPRIIVLNQAVIRASSY